MFNLISNNAGQRHAQGRGQNQQCEIATWCKGREETVPIWREKIVKKILSSTKEQPRLRTNARQIKPTKIEVKILYGPKGH